MDLLPSWQEYPKRSTSLIFTTKYDIAADYGNNVYQVFPRNNAKLGIGSYIHEYLYFPNMKYRVNMESAADIKDLYKFFIYVCSDLNLGYDNHPTHATVNELLNIPIKTVRDALTNRDDFPFGHKYSVIKADIESYIGNKNIREYLDDLLNPIKNNFLCTNIVGAFEYSLRNKDIEIWTDSICLMNKYD